MTTTITIRNEPLMTDSTVLSIGVTTKDCENLFLLIPVGNGAGDLMTEQEFDRVRVNWKIAKEDGAAGQPPDASFGDIGINGTNGEVPITRTQPTTEANFRVLVENFKPRGASDKIALEFRDNNNTVIASKELKITAATPKIEAFVSTGYNFRAGVGATLSWSIAPPGRYRLQRLDDNKVVDLGDQPKGEKAVSKPVADKGTYQLEAMLGDTVTDARSITLLSYTDTHIESIYCGSDGAVVPGSLVCAEILGIYQYKGKPYAVVRDSAGGNRASIWYTERGFDRKFWVPVKSTSGQPEGIPADAATRPGVVFDDKLYFIGGSSYDADSPGSDVGYFHFEGKTWVDSRVKAAWPKPPPRGRTSAAASFPNARMGHGLVASPDGQRLWAIGGYNGDGGALKDIWVYDKTTEKWERHQDPPWEPRCLFGATFCGTRLWIAGGFDSPGGYPTYDDIWYCDTSKGYPWQKLDRPLIGDPEQKIKQYRGCALAAIGDQIYVFVSYDEVDKYAQNKVFRIYPSGSTWGMVELGGTSSDWATSQGLVPLDCYRMDATVLGATIFIRRLAQAARKDDSIRYLVLV
jgi:hypothetical protein